MPSAKDAPDEFASQFAQTEQVVRLIGGEGRTLWFMGGERCQVKPLSRPWHSGCRQTAAVSSKTRNNASGHTTVTHLIPQDLAPGSVARQRSDARTHGQLTWIVRARRQGET